MAQGIGSTPNLEIHGAFVVVDASVSVNVFFGDVGGI